MASLAVILKRCLKSFLASPSKQRACISCTGGARHAGSSAEGDFHPRKCLLMRKITRYEYEKQLRPNISEEQLKTYVLSKGSDYRGLLERHDEYWQVLDSVYNHLCARGLDVRLVDRLSYDAPSISWCDMVMTVGGDGTFLMAASKVKDQSKPVIGINSDPERSEGYLCLPRNFSISREDAIDKIINGKFRWKWRQRIRLTMSGKYTKEEPVYLHDQQLLYPEQRFWEHVQEHEKYNHQSTNQPTQAEVVIPELALNDVFIGESLSARVSFYEISVDGSERVKQKSSGVTVCTGTGSTSWFFHINNLMKQSVRDILRIANTTGNCNFNLEDELQIRHVAKIFNKSLIFDPSHKKLAYVIRDPVVNGIFSVNNPRGFCREMSIKSRMWDAWLVVDGGATYRFNDGAVVKLQLREEDALKGVQFQV